MARSMQLKALALVIVTVGLSLSVSFFVGAQRNPEGEWRTWGADGNFTRYATLSQITADNVRNLRVVWRWATADRPLQLSNPLWRAGRNEETPLMVNGVLYTITGLGLVAALDPATGQTRWVYDSEGYRDGGASSVAFVQRGLSYWTDGRAERLLFATENSYLVSIDALTGTPDVTFGQRGKVDLLQEIPTANRTSRQIAGRRPLVAGNIVVTGSSISDGVPNKEMPPGYVQAFDIRTGKRLWTFHTVPKPGEFGYDTWHEGSAEYSGNANVWTGMAYDPDLDYVYLPTSTSTENYYGGSRPGNNLFAESFVCVEAKTGKRVWHFQAVHHGIWDYDFPATPILAEITVNGRRIKAVMTVSKQAFVYVFDRKTGEPVWPIEERPVPQSTVPHERTSPTQPFPTKPPAFDYQGATESNLMDFTPELKNRASELLQKLDHGPLFTPPSLKGTLALPGIVGGANWPGGAFDPENGILYVASRTNASLLRIVPADPQETNLRFRGSAGGPGQGGQGMGDLASMMTVAGLPLFKAPYFRLTAIDMNEGELLWTTPLGNGPRSHPLLKDLNLPPLGGDYHRGGVMVTKTLVFAATSALLSRGVPERAAWTQWADPNDDRRLLYVLDKRTGHLLHSVELQGLSAAAPMTYLYRGKQYVVVATGAGPNSEIVALSLPEIEGASRFANPGEVDGSERRNLGAYFALAHLTAPTRTAANCFGRSMCP